MTRKKVLSVICDKSPEQVLIRFCKLIGKSPIVLGYQQGVLSNRIGPEYEEMLADIVSNFMYAGMWYAKEYPDNVLLKDIPANTKEQALVLSNLMTDKIKESLSNMQDKPSENETNKYIG